MCVILLSPLPVGNFYRSSSQQPDSDLRLSLSETLFHFAVLPLLGLSKPSLTVKMRELAKVSVFSALVSSHCFTPLYLLCFLLGFPAVREALQG